MLFVIKQEVPELDLWWSEDDLEDRRQSDCLEMDSFVKHGHEVLLVPDADIQAYCSTKQVAFVSRRH